MLVRCRDFQVAALSVAERDRMSRPFDDRGVVGEVGGVVEFIGTTEQFRVEDLGRLYDSQRIAVDRVRSVGCELPQGIDGFDDRNGRPVGRRTLHGFQNQVGRYQRTYAVVDRDQCDGSGQSGQAVAYRVEPLRPARRAGVLGYVETGCQITPVPCCSISVSFRIRGYCP